jgi:YidC/Oxa1 family membrane protein insertase
MEKRVILFICIAALILIGSQLLIQKNVRRPPQAPLPTVEVGDQSKETPERTPAEATEPANVSSAAVTVSSAADTLANNQRTTITGDFYQAVADNKGAVLTSWKLNNYKSSRGATFEMIAANQGSENWTYPGSLIFRDSRLTALANKEYYEVTVNGVHQDSDKSITVPATIEMILRRSDLEIRKQFVFDKDNYLVDLLIAARKEGKPLDFQFILGQDIGPTQEHLDSSGQLQAVYSIGGKVKRESPPKDEKQVQKIEGESRWVGLEMHYFAIIAIPSQPLPYYQIQKRPIKTAALDGKETERDLLKLTTPASGSLEYRMYIGPKKQSNLEAVKTADISGVVDYGMFSIIVMPLLTFLRWINQYVNNYGYAIIILTFLLSLILFPFRLKQMLSMKKMQAVQPKVKAIQEKYRRYKKTDPKRAEMNQEIMALYKEHNVNPLGGCLPLVLQMPLLFAFYSLLQYSIELRHAPFIGYLQDLSTKDPYYVLPIVMGITMFVSQKMTPMTPGTDPTASKMMTIMPAIFTIMFLNVSSGLNLYFLCSNIFQVGFQKIAERWMGDGKARAQSKP